MISIGKENRSSQCLSYKDQYGRGRKRRKKKREEKKKKKKEEKRGWGGDTLTSSWKDWVEFYGCIK